MADDPTVGEVTRGLASVVEELRAIRADIRDMQVRTEQTYLRKTEYERAAKAERDLDLLEQQGIQNELHSLKKRLETAEEERKQEKRAAEERRRVDRTWLLSGIAAPLIVWFVILIATGALR